MKKALAQKWIDYLVAQPESGMGYQRVDVQFDNSSSVRDCVVFNSEQIDLPDDCINKTIVGVCLNKKATKGEKMESFGLTYDFDNDDFIESSLEEWQVANRIAALTELPAGGLIVLSTDVNAKTETGLKGWIKSFLKSQMQRLFKTKMVDEAVKELMKKKGITSGWSIGNLFRGRYYDSSEDKLYNEKSFSVKIAGVDFDFVKKAAKALGKKFGQKQVLLVDYANHNRTFLLDT